MRTLKFTHEEVETLLRALGIAEAQFSSMRKSYIEKVANVRGTHPDQGLIKEADIMLNNEFKFCNLLCDIQNGEKDV